MPPAGRTAPARGANHDFAIALARGAGGALIFAIPMFMTMEMWELGATMSPLRLALLLALTVPLLVGLSRVSGFEETARPLDDIVDAFVAVALGAGVSWLSLLLLGALGDGGDARATTGRIALQTVPASIGALLAQSTFGLAQQERQHRAESYGGELFLMVVGALFLALNIAPTEEVVLLAWRLDAWQLVLLALVTLGAMHAFVYSLEFRGVPDIPEGTPHWELFVRFTVVGYALVLLVSAYVLWTFGRLEDASTAARLAPVVVLAFPSSIGAAAARLIL